MILAVGMTFVIASGVMDLSAGSIVSLCGVLTALALHGGIEIWAAVLTGIAAGGLMGALNGALIHCTGINFFVLTPGLRRYAPRNFPDDYGRKTHYQVWKGFLCSWESAASGNSSFRCFSP